MEKNDQRHTPIRIPQSAIRGLLPPALAHDEQYRVRFLREARVLARVKHPNLVPIYSVAEEQGVYYYAMEFVEGESLRKRVAVAGSTQLDEMLRVAGQGLSALDRSPRTLYTCRAAPLLTEE